MLTFGGFIFGTTLMAAGLAMVIRTDLFLRMLGDISELFGFLGARWLSWKILGLILIFLGFFVAFGLFGLIFQLTIGRIFSPAGF